MFNLNKVWSFKPCSKVLKLFEKVLLTFKVGIQLKVLGFILLHSLTLVGMCLNPNTTFPFFEPNSFVMLNFGQEPKVRVTTLNLCFLCS
jgi:hypothetical protein